MDAANPTARRTRRTISPERPTISYWQANLVAAWQQCLRAVRARASEHQLGLRWVPTEALRELGSAEVPLETPDACRTDASLGDAVVLPTRAELDAFLATLRAQHDDRAVAELAADRPLLLITRELTRWDRLADASADEEARCDSVTAARAVHMQTELALTEQSHHRRRNAHLVVSWFQTRHHE